MNSADKSDYDKTLDQILLLQQIQKTNPPTSKAWQRASDDLQPLFLIMAALSSADGDAK